MTTSKIVKNFVQFVYEETINGSEFNSDFGIFNKLKATIFQKLFNFLKFYDPLVTNNIAGFSLYIPFSHKLPFYIKSYPQYSSNVARIAAQVKQKYNNLTFIDIGANIGDTIAFLRSETYFPILCIEGNENFFPILSKNVSLFKSVDTIQAYIGETNEDLSAEIINQGGSSHLIKNMTSLRSVQLKKLSEILKDKPFYLYSKMIKIDTDGFDCKIIRGAVDFLSIAKPIIFFEYDPFSLSQQGDDGISIFMTLQKIGYKNLLIYDNTGDFMLSTDIDNLSLLNEIHLYFSWSNGQRYCDICIFHIEDLDLFEKVKQLEIQFFKRMMSG